MFFSSSYLRTSSSNLIPLLHVLPHLPFPVSSPSVALCHHPLLPLPPLLKSHPTPAPSTRSPFPFSPLPPLPGCVSDTCTAVGKSCETSGQNGKCMTAPSSTTKPAGTAGGSAGGSAGDSQDRNKANADGVTTTGAHSFVCALDMCMTMKCSGGAQCQTSQFPSKSSSGVWEMRGTCNCPLGEEMKADTCVTSVVNCEAIPNCKKVSWSNGCRLLLLLALATHAAPILAHVHLHLYSSTWSHMYSAWSYT